ncbi:hypothetical protein [Streptomyces sp. WL006]|uniref:hypothetical protein n=1 Tax=Streptomyces sp. WL006 TaxID=3423915 RepID=UPI003F6BC259
MTTPKPHESVQGAAGFALGGFLANVDARRAAIEVRAFDTSEDARQAIDQDELPSGSVFVVDSENVVGFMVAIFPAALTEERGPFPHLPGPGRDYMDGDYMDSVVVAEREARARGFLLRDEDLQDRIRSMRKLFHASHDRVITAPDADDPEWQMALHRMTVASAYLSTHDPVHADGVQAAARRIAADLARIDQQYGTARP